MLQYLLSMLIGPRLCAACHRYRAMASGLCFACAAKGHWIRRAA